MISTRTKSTAFILCLILIINILAPTALAFNDVPPRIQIVTYGNFASCFFTGNSYIASAVIETNNHSGSFAIQYIDEDQYIYEYYFSFDEIESNIDDPTFWSAIFSKCMTNRNYWRQIHIPTTITSIPVSNTSNVRSSSNTDEEFKSVLADHLGTGEYTNRIIQTSSRHQYLFHLYESVSFSVTQKNLYFIANAISVASFITGVLGHSITSGILGAFSLIAGGIIPSETEVGSHTVCAITQRHVRRMDSSIWLNSTCRVVSYDGYAITKLNFFAIDPDSESILYTHSEEYFYDKVAQIDDAYQYFLLN